MRDVARATSHIINLLPTWPLYHSGNFLHSIWHLIRIVCTWKLYVFFSQKKNYYNIKWVIHDFQKILEKQVFRPFDIPCVLGAGKWYLWEYIAHNIAVLFYIYTTYIHRVYMEFVEASNMHIFFDSQKNIYLLL